jgi:hypothetical protein
VQSFVYVDGSLSATPRTARDILDLVLAVRGTAAAIMSPAPLPNEIAQIEHELGILRSRYVEMQRQRRLAKFLYTGVFPLVISGFVIFAITYAFATDLVFGLFIVGMCVAIAAAFWIARDTNETTPADRNVPRPDPPPSQFWPAGLGFAGFSPAMNEKSESETLQDMIALREKRLADLKRRAT